MWTVAAVPLYYRYMCTCYVSDLYIYIGDKWLTCTTPYSFYTVAAQVKHGNSIPKGHNYDPSPKRYLDAIHDTVQHLFGCRICRYTDVYMYTIYKAQYITYSVMYYIQAPLRTYV